VANCPVLPGLSSLKIKSDETNLFCVKDTKITPKNIIKNGKDGQKSLVNKCHKKHVRRKLLKK